MELQILDAIQNLHVPLLDKLMIYVTSLGNRGVIWIALAVLLIVRRESRREGIVVAAALCLDLLLCNLFLKPLVNRARPFEINTAVQLLIAAPADASFPSGHTAAAFAVVTALWALGRKKLAGLFLVLAVLIAFSRLYLYVHYPTDVLGGAVVGAFCGLAAPLLVKVAAKRI